jgi:hypothetical protein
MDRVRENKDLKLKTFIVKVGVTETVTVWSEEEWKVEARSFMEAKDLVEFEREGECIGSYDNGHIETIDFIPSQVLERIYDGKTSTYHDVQRWHDAETME